MNLFHHSGIFRVFLKPAAPVEHLTRNSGFWDFFKERLSTNNRVAHMCVLFKNFTKLGDLEKFCYFNEPQFLPLTK